MDRRNRARAAARIRLGPAAKAPGLSRGNPRGALPARVGVTRPGFQGRNHLR